MVSNVQTALHSWDKPPLVMTYYLFYTLLDLDSSLFTIFAFKFMRDIFLCFLSLFSPNVFDFIRVPLKVFFSPLFNGNVQYNLQMRMSEFVFFLYWDFLNCKFNFFNRYRAFQAISSWETLVVCVSQGNCVFTQSCLIYWHRGVHNIPLLISSYL